MSSHLPTEIHPDVYGEELRNMNNLYIFGLFEHRTPLQPDLVGLLLHETDQPGVFARVGMAEYCPAHCFEDEENNEIKII
jgi:hypothetical protein